jgi:hypothetical protein
VTTPPHSKPSNCSSVDLRANEAVTHGWRKRWITGP